MAIIEIAKIQVRRGQENQTGIPQLAGGEFAWAEDTENLYIGLKREDGAARDANIRVLTENDVRLFTSFVSAAALESYYTWENNSSDTITSTSTSDAKVIRPTQDKLDDFVNVADFGVIASTGTEVNDCSIELQLAIDNLFLGKNVEWNNEEYDSTLQYNKKLYFPAGIYRIGETIFIPRNTVIVGEGIDKTIIEIVSTGSGVFQTIDFDGRRNDPVTLGEFVPGSNNITGSYRPENIHIQGMTLKYSSDTGLIFPHQSLLSLDCVDNAVIRDVKFQGLYTIQLNPAYDVGYTGIDIRGDDIVTSENILIDNCQFIGLHYDIKSDCDSNHIVIQNNNFSQSIYGVAFSTSTTAMSLNGNLTGPTYARIVNNKFQHIYNQGIYVGANLNGVPTNHVSENNSFIKVGDQGNDEGSNTFGTSVIKFVTKGNASVNDYFGRYQYHNTVASTASTFFPLIDGKATIDPNSGSTATLAALPWGDTQFTSTPIMRLPITGQAQHLSIKYQCVGTNVDKSGTVHVYIRPGATPTDVQVVDDYNIYGTDGGLFWGVSTEPTYKYYEVLGCNPSTTNNVQVEFQTKLML